MVKTSMVLPERIEQKILMIRGHKVMLDTDLARLYGVKVKDLNQAIRRNRERFPCDFMFQLREHEIERLNSQMHSSRRGGRRDRPYAFTEQRVAMLSSDLKSKRAVQVNIEIMRAFVRLRRVPASNKELARRLAELELRYDSQFKVVFDAIRELMDSKSEPEPQKPRIGFRSKP
jgi:hypothetical protein